MSRRSQKQFKNNNKRTHRHVTEEEIFDAQYARKTAPRGLEPFEPKTEKQRKYMNAIKSHVLTFATGSAGTGKTYVAARAAAQYLESRTVEKIIVTRPAVEAGESLGFLPGELDEKFDPYLEPFRIVLEECLGKSKVEYLIKSKIIEAIPLGYLRGRTFKHAFVILDEAQNTTPTQMKMFLTRIGEDAKVVVNGDNSQIDIHGSSGLKDAIRRVSFIPDVSHIVFDKKDVVRSGIVSEIIQAYDEPLPTKVEDITRK